MRVNPAEAVSKPSSFTPAIATFSVSLLLCAVLLLLLVTSKLKADQLSMESLILEKTGELTGILHKLLYKTEALSALVIQNDGRVNNFDRVAATLLDDPAIANVLVAPRGVVTDVYPRSGNEGVLGLDFFSEGAGNREAILAKETEQLVFGGPFTLVQGGQALVGRLPVYLDTAAGEREFWGLVSVTLRFPGVLDGLGLALLEKQGFAYEVWRTSPDSGERQVIAGSESPEPAGTRFIERKMDILNAVWYFRLAPVKMWYHFVETWVVAAVGVLFSLLVAFVVHNNAQLKRMQILLEESARVDSLTGIANRRHFMEAAPTLLLHAARRKQSCFLIMWDADHFKQVNDTYGHAAGDMVLASLAGRVSAIVRPYDLFARYGGEEFVLLAVDVDRAAADALVSRIRSALDASPFVWNGVPITVTASFGMAGAPPDASLDSVIRRADEAMYMAKNAGRDCCFCRDDAEAGI